jgi:hypothetical protein
LSFTRWIVVAAIGLSFPAVAQQQPPAGAPSTPPAASEWEKLPRMTLEVVFAGPLRDTIIQRWRDPVDGMICYLYMPITAQHSTPLPSGFVQYGANSIGSISCVPGPPPSAAAQAKQPPRPATKAAPAAPATPPAR